MPLVLILQGQSISPIRLMLKFSLSPLAHLPQPAARPNHRLIGGHLACQKAGLLIEGKLRFPALGMSGARVKNFS